MKTWTDAKVVELDVLETKGGTQGGTEKNGKGNKYNGGATDPNTGASGNA